MMGASGYYARARSWRTREHAEMLGIDHDAIRTPMRLPSLSHTGAPAARGARGRRLSHVSSALITQRVSILGRRLHAPPHSALHAHTSSSVHSLACARCGDGGRCDTTTLE